jgi:arsenate reductase
MAEAILNLKGTGRFQAFSAGLHPSGLINPFAAELIDAMGYPVQLLRSKRWVEFLTGDAPQLDFVITLCKEIEHMAHPMWPGNPVLAKWHISNPTTASGSTAEKKMVFRQTMEQLDFYIDLFLRLPVEPVQREWIAQEMNRFNLAWQESQG